MLSNFAEMKKNFDHKFDVQNLESIYSDKALEILSFFTHFQFISVEHIDLLSKNTQLATEALKMADFYDLPLLQKLVRLLVYYSVYTRKGDIELTWETASLLEDKYLRMKLKAILYYKYVKDRETLESLLDEKLCDCWDADLFTRVHYS